MLLLLSILVSVTLSMYIVFQCLVKLLSTLLKCTSDPTKVHDFLPSLKIEYLLLETHTVSKVGLKQSEMFG